MSYDVSGAATAGAAAASLIAQAIKASGAIIRVEPGDFRQILNKAEHPLVIKAKGGFFKPIYRYLTAYRGFIFVTGSKEEMTFPSEIEFIVAKEIWIPD